MVVMQSKPLTLTIVIPVYNEENYLKACLDAIAAQTELSDEVVVVDNNSTDSTVKIAKSFPFVTLVAEKKQSVLYARTTGFNAAKSDLIARIDADTIIPDDWVARAKTLFADPDLHAVTGPDAIYDMPFPRLTRWAHDALLKVAVRGGFHFLTGSNMVMRRTAWQKVAPELCEDLTIYEDIDIAFHLQDLDMTPAYSSKLWNSVSSRRFADKIPDFTRYIRRYAQTTRTHNRRIPGVYFAQAAYTFVFLISRPFFWLFDPDRRRLSLKHIFATPQRRDDPMQGDAKKPPL